ncbi:MAG: fibronectin type III domain-containing protein [Gammaproteobacteria bacterium]|nr:fibronectin type III domain-containing protein [Gammaproteobacteria bacterium]
MLETKLACAAALTIAFALLGGCRDPGPVTAAPTGPTPSATGGLGSATISWEAPTSNSNGSPLTDLAGYRIYYGSSPKGLSQTVQIRSVGLQTYVIENLEPGTWYFAVKSVATNGVESRLSDVVAKTIS